VGRDNIGSVRVSGLRGLTYISKPEGGARKVQEEETLSIDREIDRVYVKAPDAVTVTGIAAGTGAGAASAAGGGAGGRRVAGVTCKSHATLRDAAPGLRQVVVKCPLDVVVWNPWIEVSAERLRRFQSCARCVSDDLSTAFLSATQCWADGHTRMPADLRASMCSKAAVALA
jgi:hypothetical protein